MSESRVQRYGAFFTCTIPFLWHFAYPLFGIRRQMVSVMPKVKLRDEGYTPLSVPLLTSGS